MDSGSGSVFIWYQIKSNCACCTLKALSWFFEFHSARLFFSQKPLQELGLTEAVDKSKADLSNISGKKDLYLSNVFHAAAFELDTDGNEIDSSIFGTDKLKNPKVFYADHPFIFLVKDQKTNSILFIGRMVRPKGEKLRDELWAHVGTNKLLDCVDLENKIKWMFYSSQVHSFCHNFCCCCFNRYF